MVVKNVIQVMDNNISNEISNFFDKIKYRVSLTIIIKRPKFDLLKITLKEKCYFLQYFT